MARYTPARMNALMQDAGNVRNRLKIQAAAGNARAYEKLLLTASATSEFVELLHRHNESAVVVETV